MFSYYCKRCEVTGRAQDDPPESTCWCCDLGDELVPQTFSLSVRLSQGHVVNYFPEPEPQHA